MASQENRSFDTYFGYYPRAGKFGVPEGYSQPDGKGGKVTPHHFSLHINPDVAHTWQAIHSEWNKGATNGFALTGGTTALGYFNGSDLAYYYALAADGQASGPTAPPRDGLAHIGDFYEEFDFRQDGNYATQLPSDD